MASDIKPETEAPPVVLQLRLSISVVVQPPIIDGAPAPVYVMMQLGHDMHPEEAIALMRMVKAHCDQKLRSMASPKGVIGL